MEKRELHECVEELNKAQRNILIEDQIRNGAGIDRFLWQGNPKAPRVQRIGAAIIGVAFLFCSLSFLDMAWNDKSWLDFLVASAIFAISIKLFYNAFRTKFQ